MEIQNSKPKYDLEQRTFIFAKNVRSFLRNATKTIINMEDMKQLLRSSGSVGANYREANESISKKDFALRIKISRKEAKESMYWLELLEISANLEGERGVLVQEARELMKIFGAIVSKFEH